MRAFTVGATSVAGFDPIRDSIAAPSWRFASSLRTSSAGLVFSFHGLAIRTGRSALDLRRGGGRVLHSAPLRRLRFPQQPPLQQSVRLGTVPNASFAAQVQGSRALDGGPAHDPRYD